ncbi:MAG: beta-galactosidase [Anaerolineaceae bacterium]|nr:beta-galactosidase [Anaerolineaceae bacterium]
MNNSNPFAHPLQIQDGIYVAGGERKFFITADYPYYRDDPANWSDRLDKLKDLGHQVITAYIPWRHHDLLVDGQRRYDFTGESDPARDVIGFIRLCHHKGLSLVIKPGPFVHAELNYGGLPDFLCPLFEPRITPMTGSTGRPFVWNGSAWEPGGQKIQEWPLPAPLDPFFQAEVQAWMQIVARVILAPYQAPQGPIILVQLANEGIYSNHQRAVWAYDFSPSSLEHFRQYLGEQYGSLAAYNARRQTAYRSWDEVDPPRAWGDPQSLEELGAYADWSDYQAAFVGEFYARLQASVPAGLPCVLNVNPPSNDSFGVDAWLTRIRPERWPGIHYGFTNWIGVACDDRSVTERYQVMVKRTRGANMEENWGFSSLYEPAFAYDSVSFYQTLVEIASGATGYNIYTGVGTAHATPELDLLCKNVYPDVSPIDEHGQTGSKGETVRRLNEFFHQAGREFLESRPTAPMAWGVYLPDSHVRAWAPESEQARLSRLGVGEGGRAYLHFLRRMLNQHLDFGLADLQAVPLSQLRGYRTLGLAAGRSMDAPTQQKLCDYLAGGGRLLLAGRLPDLDENLAPCTLLQQARGDLRPFSLEQFYREDAWFEAALEGSDPGVGGLNPAAGEALLWLYTHPERDAQYLFVFTGPHSGPVECEYSAGGRSHRVQVVLPARSAGVLRVAAGKLRAALLNGHNDYTGESLRAACRIDGQQYTAAEPGAWLEVD